MTPLGEVRNRDTFLPNADRYVFDFKLCTTQTGWAQLDTEQDASYFGQWANPFTKEYVCYAEGDVTHRQFTTDWGFQMHINEIKSFHNGIGYKFLGIDPGFNEELRQRFVEIGLGDLLH